jgi:chemotaxis signal transduction protein
VLGLFLQSGVERYALPIASVVEVLPAVTLHPAPSPRLAGVFRYRGEVTPVLSLGPVAELRLSTRIIILQATLPGETAPRRVGLLVQNVSELKPILTTGAALPTTASEEAITFGKLLADADGVLRLLDPLSLLHAAYHAEPPR